MDAQQAAILGALIGAGAALAGQIIAAIASSFSAKSTFRRELVVRQLDEFYGPLRAMLTVNRELARSMRREMGVAEGEDWRLVQNIAEVKQKPSALAVVKLIMDNNARIARIIRSKQGLLRSVTCGERDLFAPFLGHHELLQLAMASDHPIPQDLQFKSFPRELTQYIEEGYAELLRSVDHVR